MKEIQREELKEIMLAILKDVAAFCEENNLRYFLGYGTALGAVRHHGFIPWDDDVDIIMPRPDYEKFISSYNKDNRIYKVYSFPNDDNFLLPFAKVADERTDLMEFMYENEGVGVYIDIFPLDGMKDWNQVRKVKWLNRFLNTKKAVLGQNRTIGKNIVIAIGKMVLVPFSTKSIVKKIISISKELPFDGSPVINMICSTSSERENFECHVFSDYVYMPFEDTKLRVPIDYKQYLKQCYGDFMQLPPEKERNTTHSFKAWWRESC